MASPTHPRKRAQKLTAKKSAKQVDLTERRYLVLELRKQGATYRQIAEQLRDEFGGSGKHDITKKYDHSVAYDDFKAIIGELNTRNVDVADEMRSVDLERLDALLAGSFDAAEQGDEIAFKNVMEVLKQRAAMFGYNAPTKTDITSSDGSMKPMAFQFVPYVKPDTDSRDRDSSKTD